MSDLIRWFVGSSISLMFECCFHGKNIIGRLIIYSIINFKGFAFIKNVGPRFGSAGKLISRPQRVSPSWEHQDPDVLCSNQL